MYEIISVLSVILVVPYPDLEDSVKQSGCSSDELPDGEDEFLLQHGLADIIRRALAVEDVLDLIWSHRLVNYFFFMAKYSQSQLKYLN